MQAEPYCRRPHKDIRQGRCLIWIYCSCKCKYYTKYTVQGRWAFFIFRGVGVRVGVGVVSFILCRCCCCHAWQIIRKLIRFVKNPSQIGALVNFQFVLLGLLLGKILAV